MVVTCYCDDFFFCPIDPLSPPSFCLILSCMETVLVAFLLLIFLLSASFPDFKGGTFWGKDEQFQASKNSQWFRKKLIMTKLYMWLLLAFTSLQPTDIGSFREEHNSTSPLPCRIRRQTKGGISTCFFF